MESTLTFRLEKVVQAPQEVMEDFEGPLDLILFLLGRNKIAIEDLQITLLCNQFARWIESRREMDMEVASEFITMASHLVYLKSKSLVAAGEDDEEVDLLKKALEERLAQEERAKMEFLCSFLKDRGDLYRRLIVKPSEPLPRASDYIHSHVIEALTGAMAGLLERSERSRPPPVAVFTGIVGREPYPVKAMIEEIRGKLSDEGTLALTALFSIAAHGNRSEVVAVFLAVLEMCRNGEIELLEEGGGWTIIRSKPP
jgi:segregation and condensation protein A